MDKKTATLTLTEKIRERSPPQLVINHIYQKKLIKESLACYQVGSLVKMDASYMDKAYIDNAGSGLYKKIEPQANYFFLESQSWGTYVSGSSFSILGKEEINTLRTLFYKDTHNDAITAMNMLGIKSYVDLYNLYSKGSLDGLLGKYSYYLKIQDILDVLYKSNSCSTDLLEDYLGTSIKEANKQLDSLKIDSKFYDYEDYVYEDCIKNILHKLEKSTLIGRFKDLLPGFFDFVFKIPYEDQNIETNTKILNLPLKNLDYAKILVNEYSKGQHFKEYFSCLDSEKRKKVVQYTRGIKEKNLVNDTFLWSQGFKDVELDHLRIYKEEPDYFVDYFKNRQVDEKKVILKDIMECEFVNEKVIDWINKNEAELLREVGFDG